MLGGVLVNQSRGFNTHSDGDVLSHALVDALAGAIADGDLGTHFPEDDPDTENARSLDFVREFANTILTAGFEISCVDSFIVLGTIRLRPHVEQMRANIADSLGIGLDRVSVKARSNDGIGPEGEGLAASATVVVLLKPRLDH